MNWSPENEPLDHCWSAFGEKVVCVPPWASKVAISTFPTFAEIEVELLVPSKHAQLASFPLTIGHGSGPKGILVEV